MANSDPTLCPDCGWSGTRDELTRDGNQLHCPVCAELVTFIE